MPSAAISTYLKPPAAAAGGSWTYEGGENTARTTSSTGNATLTTITGYDSSAAIAGGWKLEWLAPREDTYATGGFQIAGGGYGTGGGEYFANHGLPTLEEHNDWDTEDISSIRVSGRVGNASITLTLKGVYIYSIAVA